MNLPDLLKKYKHHLDDYDKSNIVYTILTQNKWLPKDEIPPGFKVYKIGKFGNSSEGYTFIQDLYQEKKVIDKQTLNG